MVAKNILVHSLVNLGDVLLSTSAVDLIKKIHPDAKVTMMVRPVARQLVENNPIIDEVIIFDYKGENKGIKKAWEMVRLIKSKKFDLCISFDRKLRPAIITWLAGIPVRICPDKIFDDIPSKVTWFYTNVVHITHDIVNTLQANTYQEIIRIFFKSNKVGSPVMALPNKSSVEFVENLIADLPKREKIIGLCVQGTFPLKTWPREYFIETIKCLNEKYNAIFFITGAPEDKDYVNLIIDESNVKIANFCGKTSLVDLVTLYKKTDLFVTVDTGAAHIAATTGVPMVVMYGCTSPKRWHPINEKARVITMNKNCCPCKIHAHECPKPKCLWDITPQMVLEKCEELLNL